MKNKKKEEDQPHWRKKVMFSFTQEDECRFGRLHERADEILPGINRSQVLRVALTFLECASEAQFQEAVELTAIPRMGAKPDKRACQ